MMRAGQQRLALYRRTIEFLVEQRERDGASAPADLDRQLGEVRRAIESLKRDLRASGFVVEDRGGDDAHEPDFPISAGSTSDRGAFPLQDRRMVSERLSSLTLMEVGGLDDLRISLADVYVERTLLRHDPSISAPPAADQGPTLADLLSTPGSRVLLEGKRGSGKTTCLRRLVLACGMALSGDRGQGLEPLSAWAGPLPLPICLSAHMLDPMFDQLHHSHNDTQTAWAPRLWLAIEIWLRQLDLGALTSVFQQALEQGECLVLIDDLDDLWEPGSSQRIAGMLDEFIARYPGNRFVIASHHFDRSVPLHLSKFEPYTLMPLDRAQIDAMIERWYRALANAPALTVPTDISERVVRLQGLLHGDELLDELSNSPLSLVLWVLTHAQGHPLPAARSVIRRRECELLLNGWGHSSARIAGGLRQMGGFDLDASAPQRLSLLQQLALALTSRRDPRSDTWATLSRAEIEQLLETTVVALDLELHHAREQVIPYLISWCCGHDLLVEIAPETFAMPRRRLCEYLAARELAARPDFPDRARALRHDPRWREALALAAYELAQGPESQRVYDLARLLLWPASPAPGTDPHDTLLAAECLSVIDELPLPEQSLRNEIRSRLVALLADQRTTIEERVRAGTLLGLLGDPRFEDLQPPLASIAAGPFWLGGQGEYDDEGPAHRVDVPAFAIGIYPVTNQEYAAFLKESGEPPPRYWYDARFNNPSYPVVGVTWHDAMKYCAWLQGRLGQAGLLPPHLTVRLPLEAEWEKAASWDARLQAKRRYPWGNDWSDTRANIAPGRGTWMTSPVGCYPDGVSAAGLHDCIGNVWEWTSSVYSNYPGAVLKFHEPGSYTLRGSSCVSLSKHARCTYRSRLPAHYWRYHLGFRIVLARPLNALAQP